MNKDKFDQTKNGNNAKNYNNATHLAYPLTKSLGKQIHYYYKSRYDLLIIV